LFKNQYGVRMSELYLSSYWVGKSLKNYY
jgi:hypothetical protein